MNKDLLNIIEEKMKTFSKGQKAIAKYILEHYEKAAYMTAAKIGVIVGVSESTVVRFANELGFEGYPELQHALQEYIRNRLTSVQRMEVTNSRIGESSILEKVLLSDADRIRRSLEEIDAKSFDEAVDRIIAAENIYIMGVRSSAFLAGFLNYNMKFIFDNIHLVQTTSTCETFEQIMKIGKKDVIIAITFPRYSKRIIRAVGFAHDSGADVIAITDSKLSPIAENADQLLIAQSDMVSFVDSLAAPLSIINALIAALAKKKQGEVETRLGEYEKIWNMYDLYENNQN